VAPDHHHEAELIESARYGAIRRNGSTGVYG
jgi:hypothetical protein